MIKPPTKIYDLTQPDAITLSRAELKEIIMDAVAAAMREQVEHFNERFPSRTQTAAKEIQTALLQMEAARSSKH